MSNLLRAPKECGSWYWDLYDYAAPGLESALSLAARACDVLARRELLDPAQLTYMWYVLGAGTTGLTSTLELGRHRLGDPKLTERVWGSRPVSFPDADIAEIDVLGSGTWIDARGRSRIEPGLVELSISTAPTGLSADVSVHHDIWGHYSFSGRPHPEVYRNNAPRLVAALQELSALFGKAPEIGEPTYFGRATADEGLATPDTDEKGMGPDLTARL